MTVSTITCKGCGRIHAASNKHCPTCGLGFEGDTWFRECRFGFSKGMKVTETGVFRRPASFLYENLHDSLRVNETVKHTKKGKKVEQEFKTDFKLEVDFSNGTIVWQQNKFGAFDPLYANVETGYQPLIHRHDASKFPEDQKYTTIVRFKNGQINDSEEGTPAIRVYAIDSDNPIKSTHIQDLHHTKGVLTEVVDAIR